MIKRLFVVTALAVALAMPSMVGAFGHSFGKSLCDFPFGDSGYFEVRFDQRMYDSDYYNKSYPNGGIAFSLWLGFFPTEAERDELANNVRRVIFRNKTTGSSHILTEPILYTFVGTPSGEFTLWLGQHYNLLGDWRIIVQHKFHRYTATFTITQEMLDQIPPIPVEPEVSWHMGDPNTGIIDIIAPITNGDQYRLKLFDEDGNIMTNDIMQIVGGFAEYSYAEQNMLGRIARIETRLYGMGWPILIPSETCNADGTNPGGMSRSSSYFKTSEPSLEMLSATGTAPMNGAWGCCYGPGAGGGPTTTDTMGVWTFTGSSGLRQVFSYASTDGSCSGNGVEIPHERIPFTITVDGEKKVVWSDGIMKDLPGPDGLPDMPTVSTFTIDAGPEGILKHIFYMDDRTLPWKIYRPEEEHCLRDANGYPSCLLTADVRIKQ
ncbi:MAG: hypothetical protein SWH54_00930 [Thermodesulfobacteriota bacterium]|nr:hypothetical protein [Thermodesulfobacteriota bacterium]